MAQLQHDIDQGRLADKAPGFDPAAAPLGTDEEAAGTPTPGPMIAAERRLLTATKDANAVDPSSTPAGNKGGLTTKWLILSLVGGLAVLFGVMGFALSR